MPKHAGTDQDLLAMALVGYESEKARIETAIRQIQAQLGHRGRPKAATDGMAPAKRVMSAAARGRIAGAAALHYRLHLLRSRRNGQQPTASPVQLENYSGDRIVIQALHNRLSLLARG